MWIACNYCNKHLHRTFHLQSTLQTSTNKPPRSPVNSVLSLSLPDGETEVNVAGPWDQDTVWKRVSGSLSCSEFILTPWRISAWLKGSHLHDITTLRESSTLLFVPIHAASRLTIFYCNSFLWDLHRDHGNIPLTGEVVMLKLKIWVQNPEKRGEEAVCGCQLREALEAFCLQGAQHLLREITHRGGLCAPLGLPSPWQWTWDRSAIISCPHRELIPPKPRPCLFPLTQAPEGPQETKTQLCIPAGHCLLPRAFPSICQNIWRN